MKFQWRKLAFWSLAVTIPMIAFRAGQKYSPDGHSIAKCDRCRALLHARAGLRLQMHLVDDHKLRFDDAVHTVNWIYARIGQHRKNL